MVVWRSSQTAASVVANSELKVVRGRLAKTWDADCRRRRIRAASTGGTYEAELAE